MSSGATTTSTTPNTDAEIKGQTVLGKLIAQISAYMALKSNIINKNDNVKNIIKKITEMSLETSLSEGYETRLKNEVAVRQIQVINAEGDIVISGNGQINMEQDISIIKKNLEQTIQRTPDQMAEDVFNNFKAMWDKLTNTYETGKNPSLKYPIETQTEIYNGKQAVRTIVSNVIESYINIEQVISINVGGDINISGNGVLNTIQKAAVVSAVSSTINSMVGIAMKYENEVKNALDLQWRIVNFDALPFFDKDTIRSIIIICVVFFLIIKSIIVGVKGAKKEDNLVSKIVVSLFCWDFFLV